MSSTPEKMPESPLTAESIDNGEGTRSRSCTRGSLNGRIGSHNRRRQAATKRTGYGLSRSSRPAKPRVTPD
jgi:hypothetical protein